MKMKPADHLPTSKRDPEPSAEDELARVEMVGDLCAICARHIPMGHRDRAEALRLIFALGAASTTVGD